MPAKQDGRKAHQQRIPTGHKADAHGVKLAHKQALMLASANSSGSFTGRTGPINQRYQHTGEESADGGRSGDPVGAGLLQEHDSDQCSGTDLVPVEG